MAELKRTELSVQQERAVLVGVILPDSTSDPRDPLGELASLAKTAGARWSAASSRSGIGRTRGPTSAPARPRRSRTSPSSRGANVVLFDNDLSPGQIGALRRSSTSRPPASRTRAGIKVLDRSELILDIFATRAQTHEAKLQVELAQMEYTYPRLTKMWGHLERIAGSGGGLGIGTRGPGETQLETDRRLVRKRISAI